MKVIDKLKQAIYELYCFLYKSTFDLDYTHKSITQEEANALYELLDSYKNDDSGK